MDEAFIQLLLKNNISYIPTLVVHGNYVQTYLEQKQFSMEDFNISNPFPLGSYFDLKIISNEKMDKIQNSPELIKDLKARQAKYQHVEQKERIDEVPGKPVASLVGLAVTRELYAQFHQMRFYSVSHGCSKQ